MTDKEVQVDRARFRGLDVTWVDGTKIGRDIPVTQLLKDGYQAVFLSIGTSLHRTLGVPGENLEGVLPALEFLKRLNRGEEVTVGKRIVVVGGGDVAMDSIRSSLRLSHGGSVTLVYRRSKAEMPADKEELHGAEKEGIHFEFLKAPLRVVGHDRVEGLVVQRMELGAPDAGGRRAPVPVPGSEETIPCDTLIVAVGQKADLEGFGPELGLKVTSQGWPEGARPAFATDVPGIFAAGGRSVVYAMGTASQAAEAIDAYLSRKRGEASTARPDPFGGAESFHLPAGYTAPIRE
jgi:NADPH-dependent glutamate synthase beta subunit-like oxidoreductase